MECLTSIPECIRNVPSFINSAKWKLLEKSHPAYARAIKQCPCLLIERAGDGYESVRLKEEHKTSPACTDRWDAIGVRTVYILMPSCIWQAYAAEELHSGAHYQMLPEGIPSFRKALGKYSRDKKRKVEIVVIRDVT